MQAQRLHGDAERRIDPRYQWIHDLDIPSYVERAKFLPKNACLVEQFLLDARLGKTIKGSAKKRVQNARLVKYVQDLKKLDRYFKKPLDQVTQTEMESFIVALEDGSILSAKGTPFALETQVAIKKIVIKFYRWNAGGTTPPLVSWIDTSYELKDYDAPREADIQHVLSSITSNTSRDLLRNRAIISTLFDGGLRADELLNVRVGHVWRDKGVYWVRIQYSKTKRRTINLPLSTEHLDRWLSNHLEAENADAPLFNVTYGALLRIIDRAGKQAGVRMKFTPHTLRHGSATHWARHLSRYQLCYRMGWNMSSRQPDRYIDQEGLDADAPVKVTEGLKSAELKQENDDLRRRLAALEESMNRLLDRDRDTLRRIIREEGGGGA